MESNNSCLQDLIFLKIFLRDYMMNENDKTSETKKIHSRSNKVIGKYKNYHVLLTPVT